MFTPAGLADGGLLRPPGHAQGWANKLQVLLVPGRTKLTATRWEPGGPDWEGAETAGLCKAMEVCRVKGEQEEQRRWIGKKETPAWAEPRLPGHPAGLQWPARSRAGVEGVEEAAVPIAQLP